MFILNKNENKGLVKRLHYKKKKLKDGAHPPQRHP